MPMLMLFLIVIVVTITNLRADSGQFLSKVFVALIACVVIAFVPRLGEISLARRFRKSPFCGGAVRVDLTPSGYIGKDGKGCSNLDWSAFTSARRFDDGFLLFQTSDFANWLPSCALTEGSVEDVDELIAKHVADYKRV